MANIETLFKIYYLIDHNKNCFPNINMYEVERWCAAGDVKALDKLIFEYRPHIPTTLFNHLMRILERRSHYEAN